MSVQEYLERLQERVDAIFAHQSAMEVTISRVRDENPDAMELLTQLAFLGTDPIPLDLLQMSSNLLTPRLADIVANANRLSVVITSSHRCARRSSGIKARSGAMR